MYFFLKVLKSLLRLKYISQSEFYFNKYVKLKKNFLFLAKEILINNRIKVRVLRIIKQCSVVCD